MSTQVWRLGWYANVMACAFGNFLVAARADVVLECFVGLNAAHFNVAVETVPN